MRTVDVPLFMLSNFSADVDGAARFAAFSPSSTSHPQLHAVANAQAFELIAR